MTGIRRWRRPRPRLRRPRRPSLPGRWWRRSPRRRRWTLSLRCRGLLTTPKSLLDTDNKGLFRLQEGFLTSCWIVFAWTNALRSFASSGSRWQQQVKEVMASSHDRTRPSHGNSTFSTQLWSTQPKFIQQQNDNRSLNVFKAPCAGFSST